MEGVFHEDDGEDETDVIDDLELCDLGTETNDEWEEALKNKLSEATANSITTAGQLRLKRILCDHR